MVERWVSRVFFLFLLCMPLTRRFSKIFRSYFESIIPSDIQLPGTFDWHHGVYIGDFAYLLLFIVLAIVGRWSWKLWVQSPTQRYLTLFLATVFISILTSSSPHYPIHYLRFMHLLLPCLLFYFMSEGKILNDRKTLLTQVATAVVILGAFESLVCLVQYFTQHGVGLKYLGEPALTSRHVPAPSISVADGSLTLFDHWLSPGEHKPIIRAVGTLYHPNICAGFLVFSLLFSYALYLKVGRKRWINLAIFLQIVALFVTFSRAALYAWVLGTALWFFFLKLREKKLALLLLSSAVFCLVLFYPQLSDRGGVFSYNATARGSDYTRLEYALIAGSIIQDHPWLGIGFDHYLIDGPAYAYKLGFTNGYYFNYVHNIFLFIAAENGLIGLIFFLLFIVTVVQQGWSVRKGPEGATLMALFICFLFLGSCDIYLFMSQIGRFMLFLTAAGIVSIAPARKPATAPRIAIA
ncbi:MAG: O-antigen ligase family protein [Verrucomicrobia bacterium]|nr:O-antigen ligase family protein [Verrucomicrobiota bacterium]